MTPVEIGIAVAYGVFWLSICVLWKIFRGERFGVTGLPFYLIYRTDKLNALIGRVASRARFGWKVLGNIGIVVGVGSMAYIVYQLSGNLEKLLVKAPQAVAIQPVVPVPGLFVSYETFPYLVMAISITVIVHEFAHGVASLADRVPLKATGAFFMHVFVGGFVEPDDEALKKAASVTRLRVFAAGSFTNMTLGVAVLMLLIIFPATIAPFYTVTHAGVAVGNVPDGLPAQAAGLRAGDTVTALNGTRIMTTANLTAYMAGVRPGQTVVVGTNRGAFTVRTAPDANNASHALIGIGSSTNRIDYVGKFPMLPPWLPDVLLHSEYWLTTVLVSVGLINMLPVKPLDGGLFLEAALKAAGIRRAKPICLAATAIMAAVLVLNIGLSLLRFGFLKY